MSEITSTPINSLEEVFEYNKDDQRRLELLNIQNPDYAGGTENFGNLDVKTLEKLIKEKFIDLEECQNFSPTTEEFFNFMKKYPEAKAHGYIVSPERSDYRITIEGLEVEYDKNAPGSMDLIMDFSNLCRHADSFEVDDEILYSWWD